jgi:hypothetical protein
VHIKSTSLKDEKTTFQVCLPSGKSPESLSSYFRRDSRASYDSWRDFFRDCGDPDMGWLGQWCLGYIGIELGFRHGGMDEQQ